MKRSIVLWIAAAAFAAACTTPTTPPPVVTPTGEDRFLVDPRIGYDPSVPRFDEAWAYILAGEYGQARRILAEIRMKSPDHPPAILAEAAIAIRQGEFDVARELIDRARSRAEGYTAADIYAAEIALRQGEVRRAYDAYREIVGRPDVPGVAGERFAELETRLFEELVQQGTTAALREALTLRPKAREPRLTLVRQLVAQKEWDEARRALDPILNSADVDLAEVQEMLAEIDVGRGRFQEAMVRYERLARREPRFAARLEEIKTRWSAANMPPQYQRALESEAITRADFAVLLYWTVASVRFAQNLGTPPIAIDIENVAGREEIIRAIAVGVFLVDPVTRRVNPHATVNAGSLSRLAGRVLTSRGASCARGATDVLAACNVTTPLAGGVAPETPVSGRVVARVLADIDRALSR